MTTRILRKSYAIEASQGEVYTGGSVAFHAGFRSLLTPQEGRVNILPLHQSQVYVFPILGDDSKVTSIGCHDVTGRVAVAFQSGFVRIYEPRLKHRNERQGLKGEVELKEKSIDGASVRYEFVEVGKWKCEGVNSICWSPFNTSNPLVACACFDGSIKVFDQIGQYCTHNFRGHSGPALLCKFEASNEKLPTFWRLYSSSQDCSVRVWSLHDSKQIAILKNHMSPVTDIQFALQEKDKKVITVGRDQIISVYNIDDQFSLYTTIPVYESLEACLVMDPRKSTWPGKNLESDFYALSSDIMVVGEHGVLKIYNSKSSKCIWDQGNTVNDENGQEKSTISKSSPSNQVGIDYLIYVPSISKSSIPSIISNSSNIKSRIAQNVAVEDLETKQDGTMEPDDISDQQSSTDEMLEKDIIVAVSSEQTLLLYDLESMKFKDSIVGFNDDIIDAAFLNDDEVVVATNSTTLRLYQLPSFNSKSFGTFGNLESPFGHKDTILSISLSPCKRYVASASKDQTLILWDVESGRAMAQLTGHTQSISCVSFFSRTSKYLASGGRDLTWKIWDISSIIENNPNGHTNTSKLGGSMLTIKSHSKDVNCIAISPNDSLLATGSQDKDIRLFRVDQVSKRVIKEVAVLKGHQRGIWDLQFSPVDQVLVSCSADLTIKLWNLKDFSCIKTFEGHTASVLKVKFISNGLQLLSSGADGLVKLWNIHDNECINTFDKHIDKIWALAVKNDGQSFVTGGGDSMLCLWKDNTDEQLEEEASKRDDSIQLEQSLSNYIKQNKFRKALKVSLLLDKPATCLQIIETALSFDEESSKIHMTEMIGNLDFALTEKLLAFVRDWNTNAKHSYAAQTTLYYLFNTYKSESMTKFPMMKDLLQALIPYSSRHFARLDKLLQSSYIIDYTLQAMNLLPDLPQVSNQDDYLEIQDGDGTEKTKSGTGTVQTNSMQTDDSQSENVPSLSSPSKSRKKRQANDITSSSLPSKSKTNSARVH